MFGVNNSFFGRVTPLLIRDGADYQIPNAHNFFNVFTEMFLQVIRDYNCIKDYRKIKISDIVYLYDGLRAELKEITKPRK